MGKLYKVHQDGTRFLAIFAIAYSHEWWQWHQ